jgi:hypothetical protein
MILACAGALAAAFAPGCTATQARQVTASGAVAVLDCEDGHIDAQMIADVKALAAGELQRLIAGAAPEDLAGLKAKLLTELAPIKSDAGRCGITGLLAALAALTGTGGSTPGAAVSALTAPGPDPRQVRAAFGAAAREAGWPPVKMASGEVL